MSPVLKWLSLKYVKTSPINDCGNVMVKGVSFILPQMLSDTILGKNLIGVGVQKKMGLDYLPTVIAKEVYHEETKNAISKNTWAGIQAEKEPATKLVLSYILVGISERLYGRIIGDKTKI